MRSIFACLLALGFVFLMLLLARPAWACSCAWQGHFLEVAGQSLLIVRGRILRHQLDPPAMVVQVLETLQGGLLDHGLVVAMGDGMHCRPALAGFPPGSEWVLALNGPGAKPGQGWALSHCGEYWLRVEGGEVSGRIFAGATSPRSMTLTELKTQLRPPRFDLRFIGVVREGETFRRPFADRFEFALEARRWGWEIVVRKIGEEDNLARLTPPLHFLPNPREIEGWHFLADPRQCRARPYEAESGPENPRRFIFSPKVGELATRSPTPADLVAIEAFGRGTLTVEEAQLGPPDAEGCPSIRSLRFSVQLTVRE